MIEIEGELPFEDLALHEADVVKKILENYEVDGFRKGKVPEAVARERLGDMVVLEEMAERAIAAAYPEIIKENKIDAIGRPEIIITKIARGSALGFRAKTAVVPDVKLPDYKKIAKENNSKKGEEIMVTDEEVENTVMEIRRMRAHQALHENTDHESQNMEHAREADDAKDSHDHGDALKDENLPPLDDDYVKKLGNFETVSAFREKLRENIKLEKERAEKDKKRAAMIEELVLKTDADVPEIVVLAELDKMLYRMQGEMERAGIKMEDYLKHLKKTEDDIRNEWRNDAKKRATMELVIDAIAKKENIVPDAETVEKETAALLSQYQNADPLATRAYVMHVLTNEKVLEWLESA